jgi:hypoxanthine phosphoribosyltransferase
MSLVLRAKHEERREVSAMTTVTLLFDAEQIAQRVDELAREIRHEVGAPDLALVGILKGSFMFMADLARALERAGARPQIEFMRLASYGQKKESSGEVMLLGDAPRDFEGRPVVVVDDIVDTGLSMDYGRKLLAGRNVAAVHTCALLDKPSRRNLDVAVDFVGFIIPDVFVVGYGIDYAEQYRYLPYIGKVD